MEVSRLIEIWTNKTRVIDFVHLPISKHLWTYLNIEIHSMNESQICANLRTDRMMREKK